MRREKIILSNLDLELLRFIIKEKYVNEIMKKFNMNSSGISKHFKRLFMLGAIESEKYGTFRIIKITTKGEKIIKIL